MKSLTIKNFEVDALIKVISYAMPFQKGRVKNRFLMAVGEKKKAIETSRVEILNALGEKDTDGNLVVENNAYKLSADAQKKFNEEFFKLMNEDCIIDLSTQLEKDVPEIKQIINNSQVSLETNETADIESVMTAFDVALNKPKEAATPKKAAKK